MFWTPNKILSDFSERHLYLLQYAGFTRLLSYYPVNEREGDTIRDIVSGNDGALGRFSFRSGFSYGIVDT
jgi:hypothetical protein